MRAQNGAEVLVLGYVTIPGDPPTHVEAFCRTREGRPVRLAVPIADMKIAEQPGNLVKLIEADGLEAPPGALVDVRGRWLRTATG